MSVYICGGNLQSGTRDTCPDPLHDFPLPDGYVDAGEAAARRLRKRWSQQKCGQCGLYGWLPGQPTGDQCDARVPAPEGRCLMTCPARVTLTRTGVLRCTRPHGHRGEHVTSGGTRWGW